MSEWHEVTNPPARPMDVLLYRAEATWWDRDRDGDPVSVPDVVRYDIGYWRGVFFYSGTNHEVFEFSAKPGDAGDLPTHWQPLPKPPTT